MKLTFLNKQRKRSLFCLIVIQCLFNSSFSYSMPLTDPNYSFAQSKLDASKNSFMFLRSFVDYFYLLTQANQENLPSLKILQSTPGWCVGDAHPENFGALLQNNGSSLFTINDVDDSGPCPVGLDLLRLMVSSNLYNSDIEPQSLLNSYLAGLNKEAIRFPSTVKDMLKKSQKNGASVETSKIIEQVLDWNNETRKVTSEEKTELTKAILSLKPAIKENAKILDLVARVKIGGGSGGQLRYEALIFNSGHFLHLELKEQGRPSIYPVATTPIPDTMNRILQTLSYTQPLTVFNFYNVVKIKTMDMLVRPLFSGNLKIKLDKQSGSENKDLINYEAYTLGLIHSRSVSDITAWKNQLESLDIGALEKDVSLIVDHFEEKYSSLK